MLTNEDGKDGKVGRWRIRKLKIVDSAKIKMFTNIDEKDGEVSRCWKFSILWRLKCSRI